MAQRPNVLGMMHAGRKEDSLAFFKETNLVHLTMLVTVDGKRGLDRRSLDTESVALGCQGLSSPNTGTLLAHPAGFGVGVGGP